ncbi:MAG: hypothetical protein LBQ98_08375 [Nitrososphaerota archaeon]|jgi:hypothetical protein|nr:hypothetical protein [Nitrososphaerota archaeon]
MNQPPETIRDRLLHEQIDRRLNVIADEKFQRIIDKLSPYEAHILTTIRTSQKTRTSH